MSRQGHNTKNAQEREFRETVWYVEGMHCPSCEAAIERAVIEIPGVRSCVASLSRGEVMVEHDGRHQVFEQVKKTLSRLGYRLSEQAIAHPQRGLRSKLMPVVFAGVIVGALYAAEQSGFTARIWVGTDSALPFFLLFGLMAGLSGCVALVGGIVLTLSRSMDRFQSAKATWFSRLAPHLLFNGGRLAAFAGFGAVLGFLGGTFRFSYTVQALVVMAVAACIFVLGLQMLGMRLPGFSRFTFMRWLEGGISGHGRLHGGILPFALGALTVFLPCGFTITVQGIALLSGSAMSGALILFLFALGTTPVLVGIGFTSVHFLRSPRYSQAFLRVAGTIVVVFALFTINYQLNMLGLPSPTDLGMIARTRTLTSSRQTESELPPLVGRRQVVSTQAMAFAYEPELIRVREGVPVRWEIEDQGFSGCTDAVISRDLFEGEVDLVRGGTAVVEFDPPPPGRYKFSCWMGMIAGYFEVVDDGE